MKTSRPSHFYSSGATDCNCWAVSRANVRRAPMGRRARALREAMLAVKERHPFMALWAPFCVYGRHA